MDDYLQRIRSIASTYTTDTIFILGKGPTIDRLDLDMISNSLVIGLNDAERIASVDFTIFHDEWVKKSIAQNGYCSKVYFTHLDFSPIRGTCLRVPYVSDAFDVPEMMMQRLLDEELAIEEILFLTALKIARLISIIKGRKQTVYMLGFDFSPEAGNTTTIGQDYSHSSASDRANKISPQEYYLINTLYILRNSSIDIKHVGDKPFSSVTPEELNRERCVNWRDDGPAAPGSTVDVVAELTTNHFGERLRLERMIRAAKSAGANSIKLQKRDVESFYSKDALDGPYVSPFGRTLRDYRNALELDRDDFEFVDTLCKQLGLTWFASVLDQKSFEFMLQFNPKIIKLPSTISERRDYLSYVADNYFGEIVISTGMTTPQYEEWVLSAFQQCSKLYLLQCNSAYPTLHRDCSVGVVRHYRDLSKDSPKIVPGYSSHDFGWLASTLAVAAGAQMVEKHVKWGNTEWAHFDAVAVDLTTTDFADYVSKIREAELIIGSEKKKINSSEHHKYHRTA